jgi:pimeloyl-ACP methyl ester carboxylesterase
LSRWRIALAVLAVLALGAGAFWWLQRPQTIVVDGRKVQIRLAGSGSPAVVIEAGFGGGLFLERRLQDNVAKSARVLAYERAGFGASEQGPAPRDAEQIARELHALLAATHIAPPYVLVGHSAGGLFIRVFAHLYPGEVAGLVLVDPATEETYERMPKATPADWAQVMDIAKKLGPTSGMGGQFLALPQTLAEARGAWPLPAVPTVILTSTKPLGAWPLKTSADLQALQLAQDGLVSRIPGAKHVVVDDTDHLTILQSDVTAREVLAVVNAAKQSGTAAP